MQERHAVLVLSQSSEGRARIRKVLSPARDLKVVDIAEVGPQGLAAVRSLLPDVVIVDSAWGNKADIDFIRSVASALPTSVIMIVAPDGDMDYVQQALLAGARGFVTRSSAESDLVEALDRVLQLETTRLRRQAQATEVPGVSATGEGRLVSVFSAKGGVGCTVIAVNLAVALRRQTGHSICLFDCDLDFGNVAVLLNIWPQATLGDLVPYADDLSPPLVEEVMLTHSSGVKVLLPPPALEDAERITPHLVTKTVQVLKSQHEFTVVDTGSHLDSISLAILDSAFRIVFVTTPEVPALHNLRRMLQLTEDLGYPREKVIIIGNRFSTGWGIQGADIAESLGYPVSVALPSDGRLVTEAANRGVPFVIDAPGSGPARAVHQLAEFLVNTHLHSGEEEEPRSRRRWFLK
jgi:pilus assembly protein CpaE